MPPLQTAANVGALVFINVMRSRICNRFKTPGNEALFAQKKRDVTSVTSRLAPPAGGRDQVLGAVLALQSMVMARMPSTTPSDTATGILKMSISIILVPMKTRITARP